MCRLSMHELHSWPHISQVLYYFVRKFAAIVALQCEWCTNHTKDVHQLKGHFLGGFALQGTKNCKLSQMVLIVHIESVTYIWFRMHIDQFYLAPRIHVMWKDWTFSYSPSRCLYLQLTQLTKCQIKIYHLSSNVAILLFQFSFRDWKKETNVERKRSRSVFANHKQNSVFYLLTFCALCWHVLSPRHQTAPPSCRNNECLNNHFRLNHFQKISEYHQFFMTSFLLSRR